MKRAFFSIAALALLLLSAGAARADTSSAAAIAKQASGLMDAGQYARGIDLATAAITADSDYEYAYYLRAFAYRHLGKYTEATHDLDRAESLNASDGWVSLERGRIYESQDRYSDAKDAFSKAITLATQDTIRAQAYQGRADAESSLDNDRDALHDAETALQYAPKDSTILSDLANYAYATGDYAQSKKFLYRAVMVAPKDSWGYDHLGIFFYSRREYDSSLENFRKALAIAPKSWATHNRIAIVYTAQGKFDAALREVNLARSLTSDVVPVLEQGLVYWSMGRYTQAKQSFNAAIDRKNDGAHFYLGLMDLGLNQNAEAVSQFSRYVTLNKGNVPLTVSYLSIAYQRLGKTSNHDVLLALPTSWSNAPKWPAPIRAYLQGSIPADALLAEADNIDKKVTAKTFIALTLLAKHQDAAAAKADLQWVLSHARRTDDEYRLAATILGAK